MAHCPGEWVDDPSPQLYDCTQLASASARTWRGMCGARAAASRPMQAALRTNLSWVPCGTAAAAPRRWDAVRVIELLANRTLAIIGDSLGLYMFCALSCALIADGRGSFGSVQAGPAPGTQTIAVHGQAPAGAKLPGITIAPAYLLLPGCGLRCGASGFSSHTQACSGGLIYQLGQQLRRTAASPNQARPSQARPNRSLVVLHYPCTVHAASLTTKLPRRLSNVTWTDFAAWPSLLPTACATDGCARQADLASLNITMMEHATALARIEAVGGQGLALLVETVPTHFPTLKGCVRAAFAGLHMAGAAAPHEWEGFLLAALEWSRQLAAQPGGISVLQGVLRLARPAVLSKGNLEASLVHAAARYAHTACDRNSSRICLQLHTSHTAPSARPEPASSGTTPSSSCHVRSLVTARKRLSTRALSCEARRLSLGAIGWRQQIERAAAAARGVQLLARSEARDARFDAHPGRVHGARPFLDCVHNSFAPGAFDVEALNLLQALESRFG